MAGANDTNHAMTTTTWNKPGVGLKRIVCSKRLQRPPWRPALSLRFAEAAWAMRVAAAHSLLTARRKVIHKSYPQKEVIYPQRDSSTSAGYPQKQNLSTKGGEVIHNWAAAAACFAVQSDELSTKSADCFCILWITFPQMRR
ncbi:MAG TPA: hypothetical protein VFU32_01860 [Ktedonobacterales bacterium]|nr:hypothetical protein [Ktedonobacterales bacterium]